MAQFNTDIAPSIADASAAAELLGLDLDAESLGQLHDVGIRKWETSQKKVIDLTGDESEYYDSGTILVRLATVEEDLEIGVDIHFLPFDTDGSMIVSPDIKQSTDLLISGLQGLRKYLILVEAGYIRRPLKLTAETNGRVALLAKRLGFVGTQEDGLVASYLDLKEKLGSDELKRAEELLLRRSNKAYSVD